MTQTNLETLNEGVNHYGLHAVYFPKVGADHNPAFVEGHYNHTLVRELTRNTNMKFRIDPDTGKTIGSAAFKQHTFQVILG